MKIYAVKHGRLRRKVRLSNLNPPAQFTINLNDTEIGGGFFLPGTNSTYFNYPLVGKKLVIKCTETIMFEVKLYK